MYGCESLTLKKAEHQRIDVVFTVVLEKTLESPLDCKEIQPVHPKDEPLSLTFLLQAHENHFIFRLPFQ